ncbi:MAG: hypothetical protein J4F42_05490 [Desulfurellaceae bacterium]|nr:hypothetical protein [Desulfurellaceae bacterium]
MSEPSTIESRIQLLVEGNDQRNFFEAFIDHLSLADIQIQNFGGVTDLRPFLSILVKRSGFRETVQSVCIVRDAETSAQAAFQSVQSSLEKAGLSVLRKWAGSDTSVYALAGVRRLRTRMRIAYTGCPYATDLCPPAEFVSGADTWTEHLIGWTSGVGLEKMLGQNLALRGEFRYVGYENHSWLSLPDDGKIRVPAEMDSDEVDLSLSLVWYF